VETNIITDINQLDLDKRYTYADYLTWQFSEMVELIKGKIVKMSPAPSSSHQRVSTGLTGEFYNFLKGKPCQVFAAPFDVRLTRVKNEKEITSVVQPDLCVICDPTKIDEQGCLGAPEMIIEILSPSTTRKDVHDKFELYQEAGVLEYWIVSPNDKIVDVFLLENDTYQFKGKYTLSDKVAVYTLPGLTIDLEDIFA
jgi:Uma2 family endonuclease